MNKLNAEQLTNLCKMLQRRRIYKLKGQENHNEWMRLYWKTVELYEYRNKIKLGG